MEGGWAADPILERGVRVEFASNHLRRCFERYDVAVRTWGPEVATRYRQRVLSLLYAPGFNDLFGMRSLRLHRLHGERAGQYAIILTNRMRLIVSPSPDGQTVYVEEVSMHYGD